MLAGQLLELLDPIERHGVLLIAEVDVRSRVRPVVRHRQLDLTHRRLGADGLRRRAVTGGRACCQPTQQGTSYP